MADIPQTRPSLLVRLRDRDDDEAWDDFVSLYGPLVYSYVRKQGLQDADAADVAQDVFRAVTLGMSRFDYDPGRGFFRNWLFTIVRRKLANWSRSRTHRERTLPGNDDAATIDQVAVSDTVDAAWQSEWERRTFAWACEKVRGEVSERSWRAFWRTAIDGVPGKQTASELGTTVAAVYNARSRIRIRLEQLVRSAEDS